MISIVVPSYRDGLQAFVNSIDEALQEEYELIVVSPFEVTVQSTPLMQECKVIVDRGSPSRCLQRGIIESSSDIFTWGTDDGIYFPETLKEALVSFRTKTRKDGMVMRYTEEGPYSPMNGSVEEYYVAKNHEANRQPGIDPDWITAPVGMYHKDYFLELGGFDCRFEHINMNMHDYAYRLQRDGGELIYSPSVVMHCNSDNFGEF